MAVEYSAETPYGDVDVSIEKIDDMIYWKLDGVTILVSERVDTNEDGVEFFMLPHLVVDEWDRNTKALTVIDHIARDQGINAKLEQVTAQTVEVAFIATNCTVLSTTFGGCAALYPGTNPSDSVARCWCDACVSLGGDFVYCDTFYGGDIGCDGLGWRAAASFAAQVFLCMPSIF